MQYFDLNDGADITLKAGVTYFVSLKFKETCTAEGGDTRIALGYRTSSTSWSQTTTLQYWRTYGTCDWKTEYYQFTATSAMDGKNLTLAFNAGSGIFLKTLNKVLNLLPKYNIISLISDF